MSMPDKCPLCDRKATTLMLDCGAGSSESPFICIDCGIIKGIYCLAHNRSHQEFEDGTTACLECIAEQLQVAVAARRHQEIAAFIEISLPREEFAKLKKSAELVAKYSGGDWQTALLRFIISKAQRRRETPPETLAQLIEGAMADFLLS